MKFLIVLFFISTALLLLNTCDSTDPKLEPELLLKLEDVSCTEAWLQLTTNHIQLPTTINLLKNNSVTQTFSLSTQDSLLYIDSLLPNQTYSFQLSGIQNPVSSNKVPVTTLDTTSHNFTWQTFEFGQHSSSTLYDVAIIDENNIWAVGEIYMNDSLGNPDPTFYNAVHWNGQSWELKKIGGYGGWPCHTVFAFSENNVWFEGTIKWDGVNYSVHMNGWPLMPNGDGWRVNKMWGSSSNDLYAVGNNGNIAHYNGTSWSKIESGTTTNINDVWGVICQSNNQQMVYGAVSFVAQTGDQKILKIQNNKVDSLNWNTGRRIHSVWTFNNRYLYAAGGGIFENRRGYWNEITEVPLYYSRNIRGTNNNNIFVCGDFGLFAHFSGTSWKTYNELYIQGIYYSISVKNNIVITVGFNGSKAIIIKGERN
jgi:hypothetical protein